MGLVVGGWWFAGGGWWAVGDKWLVFDVGS